MTLSGFHTLTGFFYPMNKRDLEKYSSAFTLSDMEIFIFPELLYALVLANIMSPEIWKWRDDPWFAGIHKMGPLKKLHRLKQFIMDHYTFNLDLETWGLTDKETEIARFSEFIAPEVLARSNALFGYEGDRYYFDIDIRRHFGLDKYTTDIIPYWKTETVEAMNSFRFKPGYETAAGECVSLACLYAAALFIVAEIPLEKIFLLGTPLHSQNFVMIDDGVLTNNRRIVTRSMWFNGTEISSLARRALENEQVTIVAHSTGYIHSIYPDATIDPGAYEAFRKKITGFLRTDVDFEIFINFLRDYSQHQKRFQLSCLCCGATKYIRMERAFSYEHGSKNRLSEKNREKLMADMEEEDLHNQPLDARPIIRPDDPLFEKKTPDEFLSALRFRFPVLFDRPVFEEDFRKFVVTYPRLPEHKFTNTPPHHLTISPLQSREEIVAYLSGIRHQSTVADLGFYAAREMDSCDWDPFLKAAFERNPVSINYFASKEIPAVYEELQGWPDGSIYSDYNRLALPDEVVNYKRGDGLEKAIVMMNVLRHRNLNAAIRQVGGRITISCGGTELEYSSLKSLKLPVIPF
jgi:hypothetical protein